MRHRKDLIVPIRDRRQQKRWLTLRNFRNTILVIVVAFAAISISSELRQPTHGDYGRLYQREIVQAPIAPKKVEVVTEAAAPIADEIAADPMLLAPAAREQQWLMDVSADGAAHSAEAAASALSAPPSALPTAAKVAIVGGPEGVTVVKEERARPLLRGGFMRGD